MRLPSQLEQNKGWNIGVLLVLALSLIVILYLRYPVFATAGDSMYAFITGEDAAVYAAVSSVDTIGFDKQFGRVVWSEDRTKASVHVSYATCGPGYDYVVRYVLVKNSAGWQLDGYPKLLREVFC